jgi:hypothetical protein
MLTIKILIVFVCVLLFGVALYLGIDVVRTGKPIIRKVKDFF